MRDPVASVFHAGSRLSVSIAQNIAIAPRAKETESEEQLQCHCYDPTCATINALNVGVKCNLHNSTGVDDIVTWYHTTNDPAAGIAVGDANSLSVWVSHSGALSHSMGRLICYIRLRRDPVYLQQQSNVTSTFSAAPASAGVHVFITLTAFKCQLLFPFPEPCTWSTARRISWLSPLIIAPKTALCFFPSCCGAITTTEDLQLCALLRASTCQMTDPGVDVCLLLPPILLVILPASTVIPSRLRFCTT